MFCLNIFIRSFLTKHKWVKHDQNKYADNTFSTYVKTTITQYVFYVSCKITLKQHISHITYKNTIKHSYIFMIKTSVQEKSIFDNMYFKQRPSVPDIIHKLSLRPISLKNQGLRLPETMARFNYACVCHWPQ